MPPSLSQAQPSRQPSTLLQPTLISAFNILWQFFTNNLNCKLRISLVKSISMNLDVLFRLCLFCSLFPYADSIHIGHLHLRSISEQGEVKEYSSLRLWFLSDLPSACHRPPEVLHLLLYFYHHLHGYCFLEPTDWLFFLHERRLANGNKYSI